MFGFGRDRDSEVLLIACMGQVFSWDGRRTEHVGGSGYASCLAECAGELYEGGIGAIRKFSSTRNPHVGKKLADVESCVALCTHEGALIHATNGAPDKPLYEIRETMSGNLLAERDNEINAMTVHNGVLCDGGEYGVCETNSGRRLYQDPCSALASLSGSLYAASRGAIYDVLSGTEVFSVFTFSDCDPDFTMRSISSLCSHKGRLLAALPGASSSWIVDALGHSICVDWAQAYSKVRGRSCDAEITTMVSIKSSVLTNAL